jgi:NAD+ kinase
LRISFGDIGFLAEIDFKEFEKSLLEIERENYMVEERTRLDIRLDGEHLPFSLNELTVNAKKSATVIRYALIIDDELIWRDSADGVIISTPSGSTGYALSAGGPIVSEGANVFVIVPICSLNQTHKPFIVNNTSTITIQDISSSSKCQAIVDGRVRVDLNADIVSVKKAEVPAYFVRLESEINSRIFHKLRKKYETLDIVPKTAPPSAKFIYTLLKYEGRLTQKEIIEMTMLPARTVRSSINYLLKNGLIMKTSSLRDTRQHIYLIK